MGYLTRWVGTSIYLSLVLVLSVEGKHRKETYALIIKANVFKLENGDRLRHMLSKALINYLCAYKVKINLGM